eukprot:2046408-Amphidinium_carterae.1
MRSQDFARTPNLVQRHLCSAYSTKCTSAELAAEEQPWDESREEPSIAQEQVQLEVEGCN